MDYGNDKVRRKDRLLEEREAMELLRDGEYGILSMVEELGGRPAGYGIPINYVWDGDSAIYFHCAPDGHKLVSIAANPGVSLCVVGKTKVISHKFTAAYESVVVRGKARVGLDPEERMQALMLLLDKYSPDDKDTGIMFAEKSFHRTEVIRMDVKEITGKTKRVAP